MDETSFQKRHEYVTVFCDQVGGNVVHVADGRKSEVVEKYLEAFTESERAAVKTVAMDMWQGYITPIQRLIPGAEKKICFDKFHMAQHLGQAVDRVRREEHRALQSEGVTDLKGSRYLWLWKVAELSLKRRVELALLKKVASKTARAWALKEAGMDAWRYRSRHWARAALKKWYGWAIRSRLEPVKKVARMVKKHLEGLVNAIHHGVTNARSEGINSRIQWIKYTSRGFRNRDRFRNAIYFHLGGLDMTPEALKPIRLHTR
jgi:transposase